MGCFFFLQQSAVLSGKSRPVSWGPSEIRPALKKQKSVDVAFKDKHKAYEELQRQANTVRNTIQGAFEVTASILCHNRIKIMSHIFSHLSIHTRCLTIQSG